MPDYQQGKIYTIRCKTDDKLIYVGSTIETLAKRLGKHKADFKNDKGKISLYSYINDKDDFNNNWYIELYELYPCNSKIELNKREGEVIREIGTVNKNIAGRDKKQYHLDNAEKIKEQKKQYHLDNAEKIKEQKKQYYLDNVDKFKDYQKQYNLENAEKKQDYQKQYNLENADKIKNKLKKYYLRKKTEQEQQKN